MKDTLVITSLTHDPKRGWFYNTHTTKLEPEHIPGAQTRTLVHRCDLEGVDLDRFGSRRVDLSQLEQVRGTLHVKNFSKVPMKIQGTLFYMTINKDSEYLGEVKGYLKQQAFTRLQEIIEHAMAVQTDLKTFSQGGKDARAR